MKLLEMKGLDAGYGKLQILKKVDISLKKGELLVIIGPNGSGKSTAVKTVFGLTTHFKGNVYFDGQKITNWPTHKIVKLGIGYVPQGRLVFDTLTVEENLDMGGFNIEDKALLAKRKKEVLKIFPILKSRLNQDAGFLSGGQQQQLSIARALMRKPKLLLLDEPSLGLDPKTQKLIFKIVEKISKAGTTVMMVEQNAHQALKICSQAVVIENGKIAASGGKGLARQKRIKDLYLGGR